MTSQRKANATSFKPGIFREPKGPAERDPRDALGKELGHEATHDTQPVIFNFHTNLNPMALAGNRRRIISGEPSGGAIAPEPAGAVQASLPARRIISGEPT
jgi:hypothetical protein